MNEPEIPKWLIALARLIWERVLFPVLLLIFLGYGLFALFTSFGR